MEEAFSALPDAAGMNNHMGSAIMEDARSLSAVMEVLKEKGVPFVDSMTTAKSLGKAVAAEKGVAFWNGMCFWTARILLRSSRTICARRERSHWKRGCDCHWACRPRRRKITAQAIKEAAPELERAGITFVTVSELAK